MSSLALRSSYLRSVLRLISFSFLILLFVAAAFSESHVRIVRLSYVDGDVEIDKGDGHGFVTAFMNMPVLHQSKLWARDGIAEVEFENGSSIRLTPDTIVAFNDLGSDSDGRLLTKVELKQGTAYFDIRHRDPDTFELQLGRERVDFPHSAHIRVDSENREFEVAVLGGEMQVVNGQDSEVAVNKGETIHLDTEDPDRYQLAKGIDTENYDSWDHARADGHDQTVSTASTWNGSSNTSSQLLYSYPYSPGYGFGWGSTTLLVGNACSPSYSGFNGPFGYGYGLPPYNVGYGYGYGSCGLYYPNFYSGYGGYGGYILYPGNAPLNFRPHPGPRPHPHATTNTEASTAVSTRTAQQRVVIDNDVLEQRYPHASTVGAAPGPATAVPAQALVSSGAKASGVAPAPVIAVGTVTRPAALPTHPEFHPSHAGNPGAMSHASSPAMRSVGAGGGMSASRMSSPSMSSGGMRMSSSSMGGGGGMHSSGGGGHR